jgi:hypothetical protein
MTHKIQHGLEALFLFITIQWQPLFGMVASAAAIIYYVSMTKINVVDKYHKGSWRKYFKSFF